MTRFMYIIIIVVNITYLWLDEYFLISSKTINRSHFIKLKIKMNKLNKKGKIIKGKFISSHTYMYYVTLIYIWV